MSEIFRPAFVLVLLRAAIGGEGLTVQGGDVQ